MMLYVYGYYIYIYTYLYMCIYIYIVIYAYTIGKDSSFPNANANESMFFAVSSHRGTTKARPLLRDLLKIPLGWKWGAQGRIFNKVMFKICNVK